MSIPFCDHHINAFLTQYEAGKRPLDMAIADYFKSHRSLGATDRKIVGEAVFGMVRWKTLLDFLCPTGDSLTRYRCFKTLDFKKILHNSEIPEAVRLGMPEWLFTRLVKNYGFSQAKEICKILNTPAPITVRANLLKTDRETLMQRWANHQPLPCPIAPQGIYFQKRLPLFSFPEFKLGYFEVQDEGSQVVASLVKASPGELVLDYCSGSGGKSLAIAPCMQGRGQIYLHDIREHALMEAKKRFKRAGVQNAQFLAPGHNQLSRLKGKCDWVLIDVPCSGTGTFRRNPDQKWNLDASMLERLVKEQRKIAKEAIEYLKPNGKLVYATCSILLEENQSQIETFLATLPLLLEQPPLSLLPVEGGMDGFFAAVFKKKSSLV